MGNAFRPLVNLSRAQRQCTPLLFARMLVGFCRSITGSYGVSVLWVHNRSPYRTFVGDEFLWCVDRDARRYSGPWPVICHPPCGPWGKYWRNCYHSRVDGELAMDFVHRYGGIVEQPVGSCLFRCFGRASGVVVRVNQGLFGHLALKPTLLYVYSPFINRLGDW